MILDAGRSIFPDFGFPDLRIGMKNLGWEAIWGLRFDLGGRFWLMRSQIWGSRSDLGVEIRLGMWIWGSESDLGGQKIESWGWFRLRIEIWRSIFPDLNSQMKHFPRFEVLRSEIRGSRFKISQIWRSQDRDLRFRIGFGGRNRVRIGIWRWISGSDSISEVNFGSRTSSDRDREDDFGSWSSSDPDSEVDFGSRTSSDRDREVIFGLRILGFEVGFGFGDRFRSSDVGSRISDVGFRTSDVGFRVRDRISESDFGVDIGFRTSDLGFQGLEHSISVLIPESGTRNRGSRHLKTPFLEPFRAQNDPFRSLNLATSRRVTGVTTPFTGLSTLVGPDQAPDSDPKWFSIRLPCVKKTREGTELVMSDSLSRRRSQVFDLLLTVILYLYTFFSHVGYQIWEFLYLGMSNLGISLSGDVNLGSEVSNHGFGVSNLGISLSGDVNLGSGMSNLGSGISNLGSGMSNLGSGISFWRSNHGFGISIFPDLRFPRFEFSQIRDFPDLNFPSLGFWSSNHGFWTSNHRFSQIWVPRWEISPDLRSQMSIFDHICKKKVPGFHNPETYMIWSKERSYLLSGSLDPLRDHIEYGPLFLLPTSLLFFISICIYIHYGVYVLRVPSL